MAQQISSFSWKIARILFQSTPTLGNMGSINQFMREWSLQSKPAMLLQKYPHKLAVITEAGWATTSNGYGIPVENVNAEVQKIYYKALSDWSISEIYL